MKNVVVACSVALLVLMGVAEDVTAADNDVPGNERGFYLEPGLGINWLDQETGHPQPADAGFHLSLVGGYRFHRRWAVELHTGYLHNVLPESVVDDGFFIETYEEDTLTQIPIVANLVYHFVTSSRFEPYLGAGIGVVNGANEDDSGFDGAVEFIAGVRYELGKTTALGLSYRFIMVAAASAFAEEAVGNDTVNLSLKLRL